MNKINRIGVFRLAVLMAVISVSSAISLPVLAQVNPHPSIFDEPLYSHRHRRGHRLGHCHGPLLVQGAVDNGPPGGGSRGGPAENGPPGGGSAGGLPASRPGS